jgi:hypothetical protein
MTSTIVAPALRDPRTPPAPPGPGQRSQSGLSLPGAAASLAVARSAAAHDVLTVMITADTAGAQRRLRELGFFAPGLPVLQFPDWETLAYDAFSPHQEIVAERVATLKTLRTVAERGPQAMLLVVPVQTLLQRVVPPATSTATPSPSRWASAFRHRRRAAAPRRRRLHGRRDRRPATASSRCAAR